MKKTNKQSKIFLSRPYCVMILDEYGQTLHTFNDKKKADQIYEAIKKQLKKNENN